MGKGQRISQVIRKFFSPEGGSKTSELGESPQTNTQLPKILKSTRCNIDTTIQALIKEQPSPNMRLSVVIPLYKELSNGNIFRLLQSFAKQTADPSKYEIIILVNNTPNAAKERDESYLDNQKTLEIGSYLKGKVPIPSFLSIYEKVILEYVKQCGIVVHMVDWSTNGMEKNIGLIRDRGLGEAINRFELTPQRERGVVAQLDADSIVEAKFVEKIIQSFEDENLESLFVGLDYYSPEGTEQSFRYAFSHQYKMAIRYNNLFDIISPENNITVGGPQIIARVSAYKKIGGIPHQDMGEDFKTATSLQKNTRYRFADNLWVKTSDRIREDGYDAGQRFNSMSEEGFSDALPCYYRPKYIMLEKELTRLSNTNPNIFDNPRELGKFFAYYGFPFDYEVFMDTVVNNKYCKPHDPISKKLVMLSSMLEALGMKASLPPNQYVYDFIDLLKDKISETEYDELQKILKRSINISKISHATAKAFIERGVSVVFKGEKVSKASFDDLEIVNFLDSNEWILERMNMLPEEYSSEEATLFALKQIFPDYLNEYDSTPIRKHVAIYLGLAAFLKRVQNHPENFPITTQLIKRVR